MAEKLVARGKSSVKLAPRTTTVEVNGATVTKGDVLTFKGQEGTYRFHRANAAGTELTVWGPCVGGKWDRASWRTFRVESVRRTTKVSAVAAAAEQSNGVEYAQMTPGQKAAFTKRMRAMAAAAVAA